MGFALLLLSLVAPAQRLRWCRPAISTNAVLFMLELLALSGILLVLAAALLRPL